jgi:hypothetical protein
VLGNLGTEAQSESPGHFQRVDDVQVMRPGLGEVLPRV